MERNFRDGNGALDSEGNWRPLATGEILLGYPDEAQEIAGAALPQAFSRNGTFLVYRKLHENVYAFRQFINETAKNFGADFGIDNPMHAQERWRDGVPLSVAPTVEHWAESDPNARYAALRKFAFRSNPGGTKCPFIVDGIPQFVETLGGEYFFVPSMTALRMIGIRAVDPT